MKFIKNIKNIHFFKMFGCIAAVLSVIALVACIAYQNTYKDKSDYNFFSEHISKFQNEYVNVSERISVAHTVAMLLSEYECVKDYAFGDDEYEKINFSALKQICEKISENQTTFSHLQYDIYLTDFDTNVVATLSNTMSVTDMYNQIHIDKTIVEELFKDCNSPGIYAKMYLINDNSDACYITKKIYSNNMCVYIINHLLPVDYVNYCKREEFVITYVGDEIKGFKKDSIENEIVNMCKSKPFFGPESVQTMDVSFINGDVFYRGVEYAEDVVVVGVYTDLRAVNIFAEKILPIIICLCIALIIAWIITQISYRPITKMLNAVNPIYTEYTNELDFLISRIQDIKKSNEDLEKSLEKQENIFAKKVMMDILNGYIWGNNIKEYAYKYNLNNFENDSRCILFELDDAIFGVNNGLDDGEIYKITEKVFEIINEHFSRMQVYAIGYILSRKRILFVAKDSSNLKEDVHSVVKYIKHNSGINIFAVMSKSSKSFETLKKVYEELVIFIDKVPIANKDEVLTVEEFESKSTLNFYYPIGLESEIIEYVVSGEKEKTFLLLKRLLDNNAKYFETSMDYLKNFQYSMIVTVERILQKTNNSRKDIPGLDDKIKQFFSSKTKEQINSNLKQIFEILFDEIENLEKTLKIGIYEEIYDYINENYCDDISMTDISLKFNVSISFISKTLKEHYNINFKSYINDLRIMKAIDIMNNEPNVKIKDLSQRVGFNNSTSFIRVFQRIRGVTPKQYLEDKVTK